MRSLKVVKWMLALAIVVTLSGYLLADEGKYYVRLRYAEGDVFIQRMTETGIEEGIINTMLMAGDRMWTEEGRAELVFEDGTILWLNRDTKIDFQAISAPSQTSEESTIIRLWKGSIYIRANDINQKNFQIDTPACTVTLLSEGKYRIDAFSDQTVRVSSLRGVAEVTNGGETSLLKSGERVYASIDMAPSEPESFNSFEMDDFDRWTYRREEKFASLSQHRYLSGTVVYHIAELDFYGSWRFHPVYSTWIWIPNVSVGWRPYYYGYWRWYPCGWVWISYEPWGWAPYHYGYWEWDPIFGWYWIPDVYWSPAWVYWAVGPGYIGWAPVPYRKYNFFIYNNFDPKNWVFVPRTAITARDIRKVKFSPSQIKKIRVNKVQFYRPFDNSLRLPVNRAIPKNSPLAKAKPIKALSRRLVERQLQYQNPIRSYPANKAKTKFPELGKKSYPSSRKGGERIYIPRAERGRKVKTPAVKTKPFSIKPPVGTKSSTTPKKAVPKKKEKSRPPSFSSSSSPLYRYYRAMDKTRRYVTPSTSYSSRYSRSYTKAKPVIRKTEKRTPYYSTTSRRSIINSSKRRSRIYLPGGSSSSSSKVIRSLISHTRPPSFSTPKSRSAGRAPTFKMPKRTYHPSFRTPRSVSHSAPRTTAKKKK